MARPVIIQYLKLLHKYRDPEAIEVRRFVAAHADNEKFIERAGKLRTIFTISSELIMEGLVKK